MAKRNLIAASFERFLKMDKTLAVGTADCYVTALGSKKMSDFLHARGWLDSSQKNIFGEGAFSPLVIKTIEQKCLPDAEFRVLNLEHYRRLSTALKKYRVFANGHSPLVRSSIMESPLPPAPDMRRITIDNYPRDPSVRRLALANAGWKCEANPSHKTFVSKATGVNFVESHHIIPLEKYSAYSFSLDVPQNVVALCPTCHKLLHYGLSEDKKTVLRKFFSSRKNSLSMLGILTEDDLYSAVLA